MKSREITMRDLAEKLGVSTVTVSKALNDKEGVSDELKIKIKQMADDMGYRINNLAKSMKEGRSYNIGVIIPQRFTGEVQSFYLRFYQEISTVLDQFQYSGILHILSEEDEVHDVLPRIYYEKKVDGFILLGQIYKNYVEDMIQTGIPIIFLDFYDNHTDIDSVVMDNFYGAYELTNHLVDQGHQEIGFIGNIFSTSSIQDRYLGYYKSLLENRLQLNPDYIIHDRDDRGTFIDIHLPEKLPSAFVCNCDQVAFRLISQLRKSGYTVPGDVSVVGFDNDIYSTVADPQLTTLEVDMHEMSKVAVKSIIAKVQNHTVSVGRVQIKGRIVYRDSVHLRG
nr:substrate-binding domain-containing protein [Paenibacillus selenitireducens]